MRAPSRSLILSTALVAALVSSAHADEFARKVIARAAELLEQAALERNPPRVPPTPRKVKWKAKKLGSVDLRAILAMTAGDLDGDGRAEIVAVTETEVAILAPAGKRALAVVARIALPDDATSIAPREPLAAATVVGGELHVQPRRPLHRARSWPASTARSGSSNSTRSKPAPAPRPSSPAARLTSTNGRNSWPA